MSLAELADFLDAEGVVDDISHEGLRSLLREEGVPGVVGLTAEEPAQIVLCRSGRVVAVLAEDLPDGGGSDLDPQGCEFAVDQAILP
ncbi:hypothetical protein SLV14_001503 [Streptomyces sp. Je 1-4]|nr:MULTISPECIES: hypothetical protein [unclassified Streptomyces]UYB45105.1 hypothetical protein SLV14_001503 [Streptomyces sp. Je 1-4]UZQ35071.1 hypothetical protein SLV14N_001503 [Streptomyces sp. Je 1-4] [Streptomyces sp. Je 1-4 4N24]UZQ42489.1 hypothetical protein SLV14NA_001503 [Streptomyces sp. Je 1-4] [Streptomyces sp. Je 1-4 4N24_ara]